MHNPASALDKETHGIHWDFEVKTDHIIPAQGPDLVLIDKKKRGIICRLGDSDDRVKIKESEKIDLPENWKHEGQRYKIADGALVTALSVTICPDTAGPHYFNFFPLERLIFNFALYFLQLPIY